MRRYCCKQGKKIKKNPSVCVYVCLRERETEREKEREGGRDRQSDSQMLRGGVR